MRLLILRRAAPCAQVTAQPCCCGTVALLLGLWLYGRARGWRYEALGFNYTACMARGEWWRLLTSQVCKRPACTHAWQRHAHGQRRVSATCRCALIPAVISLQAHARAPMGRGFSPHQLPAASCEQGRWCTSFAVREAHMESTAQAAGRRQEEGAWLWQPALHAAQHGSLHPGMAGPCRMMRMHASCI